MEKTFVMLKPDGIKRRLIGEAISRLENKGLIMTEAKMFVMSKQMAQQHYAEHRDKVFFEELIAHISSGPVLAMVWEGPNAIALTRQLIGHRDPLKAAPGTIRGDYSCISTENIVHAADSPEAAKKEIGMFFKDKQ